MDEVSAGDLAIVVAGLWPNVGRIVYVTEYVQWVDFTAMHAGCGPGWRVRSISSARLERTTVPAMAGITPLGSLRRLDRLPDQQHNMLDFEMAKRDLADYFKAPEVEVVCLTEETESVEMLADS